MERQDLDVTSPRPHLRPPGLYQAGLIVHPGSRALMAALGVHSALPGSAVKHVKLAIAIMRKRRRRQAQGVRQGDPSDG